MILKGTYDALMYGLKVKLIKLMPTNKVMTLEDNDQLKEVDEVENEWY